MVHDPDRQNWQVLASSVATRRHELGLSQQDIQVAGGPSTAKLRQIENHRTQVLALSLRRGLERVLLWETGRIDRVLEGAAPETSPDQNDSQDRPEPLVLLASDDLVGRIARRRAAELLEDWASPDVRERFLSQARSYLTLADEELERMRPGDSRFESTTERNHV